MTTVLHWRNVSSVLHHLKSSINRRITIQKSCVRHHNSSKPVETLTIPMRIEPRLVAKNIRPVGWWLAGCTGMAFGAVVLGGITRITESGLSMVDWHLFKETPPLSQADWEKEFAKYQQFPEFKIKNKEMTLTEFKMIWWVEYIHRTWGRTIGAIFFLPATYFWMKGFFDKALKIRVSAFGVLLGIQGLMGWYMVKSGLEENQGSRTTPRVSQYRLAAHLGLAFVFYSLLLWNSLAILLPPQRVVLTKEMKKLWRLTHACKALTFVTAISGAFVAGTSAGLVYNSFPKMGDRWIPEDILALQPIRINFTENPTTIQFDHRVLALTTYGVISYAWIKSRPLPLLSRQRLAINCLMAMGATQVALGILTLLLYVPQHLAAIHQSGSLVLLSTAIWASHELKGLRRLAKA